MLSHCGLVKVLRVEAYTEGTIRFAGICYQRYPLSRLGDRWYDTHLLPVLNWNLVPGKLIGKMLGSALMV